MGLQLIGADDHEATTCQIGHAFERATDHAAQRPFLQHNCIWTGVKNGVRTPVCGAV
jgi:hypothetical protein